MDRGEREQRTGEWIRQGLGKEKGLEVLGREVCPEVCQGSLGTRLGDRSCSIAVASHTTNRAAEASQDVSGS